jgi:clan AA aspartic protease (TIGR02281 family)
VLNQRYSSPVSALAVAIAEYGRVAGAADKAPQTQIRSFRQLTITPLHCSKSSWETGTVRYQSRGGALIVKTIAQCSQLGNAVEASIPQTKVPPRAESYSPVRGSNQAIVPMISDGGTFAVPVTINNQITLKFVVDSGASDVSIPTDVVSTLVRTGTITDADFLGKQTYKLADGSTVPSQRFQIRSLKVGNRILENVTAGIAPIAGQLLLGQSFLKRFQSWSIDNGRSALILNGDPAPSDGSQSEDPSL